MAYILLWFPKPSETFIFREVVNLWKMGLPITVFTLYGELKKQLSPEMWGVSKQVERLGIPYLRHAPSDLIYWWKRDPKPSLGSFGPYRCGDGGPWKWEARIYGLSSAGSVLLAV
jgi:hypothetical protein